MPGDARLGAVLRELRKARGLTLAAVARQAGCTESLVSYVESGKRQLYPWLAERLDRIYQTGSAVTSLAPGIDGATHGDLASDGAGSDVFVVILPHGGVAMPLSRRELLAALGVGIVRGRLQGEFEVALDSMGVDGDFLAYFTDSFKGFLSAADTATTAANGWTAG